MPDRYHFTAAAVSLSLLLSVCSQPSEAQTDAIKTAIELNRASKSQLDQYVTQVPENQRINLISLMVPYLESPNWQQRANAAYVLGCLGPDAARVAGLLITAMDTQMENVAWEVAKAIGKIGTPAVPAVIKELKACANSESPVNKRTYHIMAVVAALGPQAKDAAPFVAPFLSDGANTGALKALAAIGPSCVPAVCKVLDSDNARIPSYAAQVLSKMEPAATKELVAFCRKATPKGRKHASYVFAHMKPAPGVEAAPVLCSMLSDSDSDVVEYATTALKSMGPGGVPDVSEILSSSNEKARTAAAEILRSYGPAAKSASGALTNMLGTDDDEKSSIAAGTILKTDPGNKKALDTITKLSKNADFRKRVLAMKAFSMAGAGGAVAVPLMIKALQDEDVRVRIEAAHALGEVGPSARSAVPSLLTALTTTHPPVDYGRELIGEDSSVYREAIQALVKMGPAASSAVPQLAVMLNDDNKSMIYEDIYQALTGMKSAAAPAVPALVKRISSGNPRPAIDTLAAIGPPARAALPQLQAFLDSLPRDMMARQNAYTAIMSIETDDRKKQELARRYVHDREVGSLAMSTLAKAPHADSGSLQILLADFRNKSMMNPAIVQTIDALGNAGPPAAEALPKLIKDNTGSSYSEPVKNAAFAAIKKIDPSGDKTIPLVQPGLNDPFKVRASVQLLEFIGSPQCMHLAKSTREHWKLK